MVEEGDRTIGKRRQRPGEIELAEADAEPRVLGDQGERVPPDLVARVGDVEAAAAEPRFAAERHAGAVRPDGGQAPQRQVRERRAEQHDPGGAREAPVEQAPAHQRGHAQEAGARRAQDDHLDEQQGEHPGDLAIDDPGLAQPDHRHHRPEQQAAQVVGLAHVAGGAAGKRGHGDPVAVGQLRRQHLDQADRAAGDAGDRQADAEGTKRGDAEPGAGDAGSHGQHQQGGQQRARR